MLQKFDTNTSAPYRSILEVKFFFENGNLCNISRNYTKRLGS